MSSRARWLFRLNGLVALAGLVVAGAALAVVVRGTTLSVPPLSRLAAACRAWLLPHVNPENLLLFALAVLSATVMGRAVGSAVRGHRSARAYLRTLRPCGALAAPVSACVVDDPTPRAFCAGRLRPRIYISTGAIDKLDESELQAILAHEAHHAARYDPLRLFAAQVLADSLFFLPVMRHLRRRYATLAELAADEAAVGASGSPQPLASAMLAFGELEHGVVVGVSAARVDHLLGERPGWELPVSLLSAAAVTLTGLGVLVLTAARATAMAQLSAPLLLMQSCGPLMAGVAALMFRSAMDGYRSQGAQQKPKRWTRACVQTRRRRAPPTSQTTSTTSTTTGNTTSWPTKPAYAARTTGKSS